MKTSVENWISICKILEDDEENKIIVLGKFTENVLFKMCSPAYTIVVERFLELLKTKKHLIFIYKDNLLGNFSYFSSVKIDDSTFELDEKEDYLYYSKKNLSHWLISEGIEEKEEKYLKRVRSFINSLSLKKINNLPYEKLIDVEISGQYFIESIAEGLLFRIYVPNERIWSKEFDKFITLFRDYASNIANRELKITQDRTDSGTICSLYAQKNDINEEEINNLYKEFTSFMDLCSSKPDEAKLIINNSKIPDHKKHQVFQKYIKETQRLLLDLKHEREIKLVTIKHRLENDLQEENLSNELSQYIDNALPKAQTSKGLLGLNQHISTQIININPQIIGRVDGIVCQEINGNVNFTPEEQELSKLIDNYATELSDITNLKSALYELIDKATSQEQKRSSWQKLYGFIGKIADKIGEVGVALLTKYLEQKMNL